MNLSEQQRDEVGPGSMEAGWHWDEHAAETCACAPDVICLEHMRILITDTQRDLLAAAEQAREAIRLTREYVGEELLPNLPGWSHFDADQALEAAIQSARARGEEGAGG